MTSLSRRRLCCFHHGSPVHTPLGVALKLCVHRTGGLPGTFCLARFSNSSVFSWMSVTSARWLSFAPQNSAQRNRCWHVEPKRVNYSWDEASEGRGLRGSISSERPSVTAGVPGLQGVSSQSVASST